MLAALIESPHTCNAEFFPVLEQELIESQTAPKNHVTIFAQLKTENA